MADITPVKITPESVVTATPVASTPAGDTVVAGQLGGDDLLLVFNNGHSAAVTVTIVPTTATIAGTAYGSIRKLNVGQAIPAGASRAIMIPANVVGLYVDENEEIPLVYTSGNAALTVLAMRV